MERKKGFSEIRHIMLKLSNMKTSTTPNTVDTKNNNATPAGLQCSKIKNSVPLATTTYTVPPLSTSNAAPNECHAH